jgi:hypothetical protein
MLKTLGFLLSEEKQQQQLEIKLKMNLQTKHKQKNIFEIKKKTKLNSLQRYLCLKIK